MGWSGGSGLFDAVWAAVREHVPKRKRVETVARLFKAFEDYDCDTLHECQCDEWPEIAEVLRLLGRLEGE